MNLDAALLAKAMVDGARDAVADRWADVRALAEVELRRLATSVTDIEELLAQGEIDQPRAQELLQMYHRSVRSVLNRIKGYGPHTGELLLQGAVGAVTSTVNAALGFRLL